MSSINDKLDCILEHMQQSSYDIADIITAVQEDDRYDHLKCSLSVMDGVLEGIRDVLINLKYTVDINK